jgi:hypothetical protein
VVRSIVTLPPAFKPSLDVQDMVQAAWLRDVRALNTELLGESTDLREFLFGAVSAPCWPPCGPC